MKIKFDNDSEQPKAHASRLVNLQAKKDNSLDKAIELEKARAKKILEEKAAAKAAAAAIAEAEKGLVVVTEKPAAKPMEMSVSEIAAAASEAIVAIRTATDPADIAAQLATLQQFAKILKDNPEMPEMLELSVTIEKFVAVAQKSTGAKKAAAEKAAAEKVVAERRQASLEAAQAAAKKRANVKTIDNKVEVRIAKPATASRAKTPVRAAGKGVAAKATTKGLAARVMRRSATQRAGSKAAARTAAKATPRKVAKLPRITKEDEALKKALESVASMNDEERAIVRKHHKYDGLRFLVAMGCAALCVFGIIWVVSSNNPDVSVRVAAMQTGVQASYPSYIPRDFSLKDINSEDGKITLIFYNGVSGVSFTMTEEKSSWDSAALERNFVRTNYGTNYETTHEQGVTVYMYGSSAAWVNGGVLYKINADAGILTKKQLRNIVTSM